MFRADPFLALAALLACQFTPALGEGAREDGASKQGKPAPAVQVGDPAPALKSTKWLQGDAVKKFEPGKVYVVQFWATWCGAAIRYMPHLADLQARYRDKNVTVLSVTYRGILGRPGNTEAAAAAFVKKRGPGLGYRFAYVEDGTAGDAWMRGRQHFATFVVDRTGRIAYIGGPMFLGMVLPKVVAGGASAKVVGAEMAKVDADYRAVCATLERGRGPFLRALKKFEADYPPLADFLPVVSAKLHLLLTQEKGEGTAYAKALVAKAIKEKNVVVLLLASGRLLQEKESKGLVALAVRAAEALVRIDGGTDPQTLLHLASAYSVSGDEAKAKEYARRAVAAAAGEPSEFRQYVAKEARRLGAED